MAGTSIKLEAVNYPGKRTLSASLASDAIVYDVSQVDYVTLQLESLEAWPSGMIIDAMISLDGGGTFYAFPDGAKEYTASGIPASLSVITATHLRVRVNTAGTAATVLVSARGVKE